MARTKCATEGAAAQLLEKPALPPPQSRSRVTAPPRGGAGRSRARYEATYSRYVNRRDLIFSAAALAACSPAASQAAPAFPMRRGVNLGNALEAPNEGDWGYRIEDGHLAAIADAGFDGVRMPVRWDAHAMSAAPYTIDAAFFARVDHVIETAIAHGLMVQLDCHHYDALISEPPRHQERFLALWRQIAQRYRGAPAVLMFEPLNEPNGDWWRREHLSDFQREVIDIIRADHPERVIVLGPGNWNSIDGLSEWRPPQGANIAASAHYYEPHDFTHQNAEWLGAGAPRFGRSWGSRADRDAVGAHIARAAAWSASRGIALQLGEFGVNRAVPLPQRALWTRTVREACDAHGIGWCAWDFAGAFPIWDRERGRFIPQMLEALIA